MKLIEFTQEDFDGLYAFMQPLWIETYGGFLSKPQILLLLDKYFSADGLARFRAQGYRYYKIDDAGVLVYAEREKDVYIDKLYLLPAARGKAYPDFVFCELSKLKKDIRLNVNRSNERAVKCYLKNGFSVEKQEEIPLGGGMVNCDYVMVKKYKQLPQI